MPSIPHAVAEFTPEAVSRLISSRPEWADARIAALETAPVGTGQMAHSYGLTLDYATRPDGTPDSVIAKVSSTDAASKQMAVSTGAYQREVLFYQNLAELTDVRSPRCFYAHITENCEDFVLLLEDMGPAQTV